MRDDRQRLEDILEAIEHIEKYAAKGKTLFDDEELVQTWILHHIQIIGEAARGLSEDFRQEHQEVPWRQIVAVRNILVHHYFGIDKPLVWSVVENDLPELKTNIRNILAEL